jgi:hypothetical protein
VADPAGLGVGDGATMVEGVEHPRQLEVIPELGCDCAPEFHTRWIQDKCQENGISHRTGQARERIWGDRPSSAEPRILANVATLAHL